MLICDYSAMILTGVTRRFSANHWRRVQNKESAFVQISDKSQYNIDSKCQFDIAMLFKYNKLPNKNTTT